jgi:hypothetical protein
MAALFIVIALTTEFYFIEVLSGSLRPYHFLTPIVIFAYVTQWRKLVNIPHFLLLMGFLFINALSAAFSVNYFGALVSYGLLSVNAMLAVAIALLLISKTISPSQVVKIFTFVAIISIFWSLIQVTSFQLAGLNLGLSEYQEQQISWGFAPGFRTEANAFAKFLNVAFLLTFPTLLQQRNKLLLYVAILAFSAGFLLSFTRSVLYTLPVTLLIFYLTQAKIGASRAFSAKLVIITVSFLGVFAVYASISAEFNSYATHKIANFFNLDEIFTGGSSGFRLMLQGLLVDSIFESAESFFLGSGWGQITYYYELMDREMQAGGADIVVVTAFGGIFSGLLFLLMAISALRSSAKMIALADTKEEKYFFQGVMAATLGLLITGLINGSLIAPEYWFVVGLATFTNYRLISVRRENFSKFKVATQI